MNTRARIRRLVWTASLPLFPLLSGCQPAIVVNQDVHGQHALHEAATAGDIAAMEELFKKGATANVVDVDGVAPLHRAARDGQTEVATALLEHHANPNLATKLGWTPLQLALWKGHDGMVELLLGYGAYPNGTTPEGYSVVHLAALSGSSYGLDLLFRDWKQTPESGKPDVNAKDKSGKTALELAIERGHVNAASTLILRGADVTVVDGNYNTLLHRLAGTGKVDIAHAIMSKGVSVFATNKEGKTAYDLAMEKGDAVYAEWLAELMTSR